MGRPHFAGLHFSFGQVFRRGNQFRFGGIDSYAHHRNRSTEQRPLNPELLPKVSGLTSGLAVYRTPRFQQSLESTPTQLPYVHIVIFVVDEQPGCIGSHHRLLRIDREPRSVFALLRSNRFRLWLLACSKGLRFRLWFRGLARLCWLPWLQREHRRDRRRRSV
jgi:hypothetical protein